MFGTVKWSIFCTWFVAGLSACAWESMTDVADADLDRWVAATVSQEERLLCKRRQNNDYLFLAVRGQRVKVGSRLEVTSTRGRPKAVTSGWLFQNERGEFLVTNTPPTTIKKEYVKSDGKWYLEDIQFQTLKLAGSEKLRAAIEVNKCENGVRCPITGSGSQRIQLCELSVREIELK